MESIFTALIGIVFIVLGIIHLKGNISLLHSYHRKRVKEEYKVPFGRMTGTGIIIIGGALIVSGVLSYLSTYLQMEVLMTISYVVTGVGFVAGLIFIFYAMIKYNKGVF